MCVCVCVVSVCIFVCVCVCVCERERERERKRERERESEVSFLAYLCNTCVRERGPQTNDTSCELYYKKIIIFLAIFNLTL